MQLAAQRLGEIVLAQAGARDLVCSMGDQHLITGLYGVSGTGRLHGDCSLLIWLQWNGGQGGQAAISAQGNDGQRDSFLKAPPVNASARLATTGDIPCFSRTQPETVL